MGNKGKQAEKLSPPPTDEDQDEEFDLVAFQASLDQSVNAAKQLVNSWIPEEFGSGSVSSSSVQSLREKARPPRMGLGASPALVHKQQAEDRKLKERLIGKGRNGSLGDEGSNVKLNETRQGADAQETREASESESDEEDSRSKSIGKGKGKPEASSSSVVKHAPNNPFVTQKTTQKSNPRKSDAARPPLFNDPSPSKPSPSNTVPIASPSSEADSTKTSTKKIAPMSFYSSKTATMSSTPASEGVGLSKNQRKKLRKLERDQENKKRLQEESRKEEELERNGGVKRAREEEEEAELGQGDGDVEMETGEKQETTTTSTADKGVNGDGSDSQRKKKKKRKGKGKGATSDSAP
ncbi:hypothetical protein JCM5350_005123, partial [Sporobolomyces pararoseus]